MSSVQELNESVKEITNIIYKLNEISESINQKNQNIANRLEQTLDDTPNLVHASAMDAQAEITQHFETQISQLLSSRLQEIEQQSQNLLKLQQKTAQDVNTQLGRSQKSLKWLSMQTVGALMCTTAFLVLGGSFLIWNNAQKISEQNKAIDNVELHKQIVFSNCNGKPCKIAKQDVKKGDMIDLSQ